MTIQPKPAPIFAPHRFNPVQSADLPLTGKDGNYMSQALRTDASGNLQVVIASGLGVLQKEIRFWISGALSVLSGSLRFYNLTGLSLSFQEVHLAVGTAPTGSSLILDVHKNGTTIFTAGDRPAILAGANAGSSSTFATTTIADGEYLTFDLDQVGSSVAGADLVITVLLG